jgi:hypothetical protein
MVDESAARRRAGSALPKIRSYRLAIRESRIPVFANKLVSTIRVGGLATNGFFDGGSRKAAWRSSALLPLLQRSFRDL